MKHGDFTKLAKDYINRPGYSLTALKVIGTYVGMKKEAFKVADIGAGTGKLTENLSSLGLTGVAVEPNEAMRNEGIDLFQTKKTFQWSEGSAEVTGLPDNCVDWVLMGSSFHWADTELALAEFYRILKPGGFFTAIWNPRDIENNEFHQEIEQIIYKEIPNLKRVSSGAKKNMIGMAEKLLSTEYFSDIFFIEAPHVEIMEKERYMGAWKSVNDIQVQAGEAGFKRILSQIEEKIMNLDEVVVPYKSRAWTIRSNKR